MLLECRDGMKAVPMNESEGGYQELTGFTRVKGNRWLGGKAGNSEADERLNALWDYLQNVWSNMMSPGPGGYIEGGSYGHPVPMGNGGSTLSTNFSNLSQNNGFGIGVNGASASPVGVSNKNSWTYKQWVKKTEGELGRKLTQLERAQLAKGCIGLVLFALNITGNPPLTGGYWDFEEAKSMAIDLQEKINNNPGKYPDDARVVLYGLLFYTDDPSAYRPEDGRMNLTDADLEDIDREAKADGRTNFDFGVYDPKTKMMYDANQEHPGMRVFEKTINQYINSFGNRQAFYYRITTVPIK